MTRALDVRLVVGGPWHDMDFVRLQLLALLAEHERLRVSVLPDYRDPEGLAGADALVTYSCDTQPDAAALDAMRAFLGRGRRWLALHGTNSALRIRPDGQVETPPLDPAFRDLLGSEFRAHPPIGRYKVSPASDDPLVAGIGAFHVEDELYLQDEQPGNEPLLTMKFGGTTNLFARKEWPEAVRNVMYRRRVAGGEIVYLTLGHARGRYDMRPMMETYPLVERGAWTHPVFCELLRRAIRWAIEGL